jgi:broad specificity phosphatase PhoE
MHELSVLVSSEETKAVETAELVSRGLRIEARTASDLDEHRRPFVEHPEEFERRMEQFFAEPGRRVFGEESAEEAMARFSAAIDTLLTAEAGRNAGVVAHGPVIALYAAPLLGIGAAALWQRLKSPSFVVIDTEAQRVTRIMDEIE